MQSFWGSRLIYLERVNVRFQKHQSKNKLCQMKGILHHVLSIPLWKKVGSLERDSVREKWRTFFLLVVSLGSRVGRKIFLNVWLFLCKPRGRGSILSHSILLCAIFNLGFHICFFLRYGSNFIWSCVEQMQASWNLSILDLKCGL